MSSHRSRLSNAKRPARLLLVSLLAPEVHQGHWQVVQSAGACNTAVLAPELETNASRLKKYPNA